MPGTDFDDILDGDAGDNTLYGLGGDDTITGGLGADLIDGGDGDDDINGESGNDTLIGGTGDDWIEGESGDDSLDGGDGDDILFGGRDNDTIIGGKGDDWLDGDWGNDTLEGGEGDDVLFGGEGNDWLDGGAGDDLLVASGNDTVDGGAGIDTFDMRFALFNGGSVDLEQEKAVWTYQGIDYTDIVKNVENVMGGLYDDQISGDEHDNTIFVSPGYDVINGRGGSDTYDMSGASVEFIVNLDSTAGYADSICGCFTADLESIENVKGGYLDDRIIQSTADNAIDGGGGVDTVVYAAPLGVDDIQFANGAWTVTQAGQGTDTLTNIDEIEISSDGSRILLVGPGGYDTLQDAINAADDGDTIRLASGTLADTARVTVDKQVTILGNYAGVEGTAVRDPGLESVLKPGLDITVDGVTIDGMKFVPPNNYPANFYYGVRVAGSDVTITNSIVAGSSPLIYGIYTIPNASVGNLHISDNLITGLLYPVFAGEQTQLIMTGNRIDGLIGVGLSQLAAGSTVIDNNFAGGGIIYYVADADEDVGAFIGINTFNGSAVSNIDIFVVGDPSATGLATHVLGTAFNDKIFDRANNPDSADTLEGLGGNDTLSGAGGNDTLVGGDGDDTLTGGAASDTIIGGANGAGGDTAVYEKDFASYTISRSGGGYAIIDRQTGDRDLVTGVENFKFSGGTTFTNVNTGNDGGFVTPTTPTGPTAPTNNAPTLSAANADTTVQAGTPLSLTIGDGHFSDQDGTDLDYTITVNGIAMPAWMTFNAETGALAGAPTTAESGTYAIVVTATDGSLTASDSFTLTVSNTGAPAAELLLSNNNVAENSKRGTVVGVLSGVDGDGNDFVSYALGTNLGKAFKIVGDEIVVSKTADLDFETKSTYQITVVATDEDGGTFEEVFTISLDDVTENPKGTRRNDDLVGDAQANRINGKSGNDTLTGGDGADTFVFGKHYGRDTIEDFDPTEGDVIDLSKAVGIKDFEDLIANHIIDNSPHLKISAGDGSVLIIKDFDDAANLTADMFAF